MQSAYIHISLIACWKAIRNFSFKFVVVDCGRIAALLQMHRPHAASAVGMFWNTDQLSASVMR